MRNLIYILLFLSNMVYSIDDPFTPLQFSVGEELIKPLIEGDTNFSSVQWTAKSLQTITSIASGSNVLVPIVTSLDAALKKAAQNSTSGNTGSGTVVATGNFVSAVQAMSVSQSGVFIQAILGLLDFSGKSFVLMSSKKENGLTIQSFFDMSVLSKLSWQQVVDLSTMLSSFASVVNITPLSANDVINRSNQFKYFSRYQCGSYQLGGVAGTNGYCMPNTVLYTAQLMGCGINSTNAQSSTPFASSNYEREVKNLLGTQTIASFTTVNCPTNNCLPDRVHYNFCDYDLYFNRKENPVLKCPQGLIFDPFDSNYYGGADIQVCKPNYVLDEVNSLYNLFINDNNNFPYLEIYPDSTINIHPYISDSLSVSNHYPYNVTPSLSTGHDYFSYTKSIDQNVSASFSFKPLLSENAFLISRTINGLKLLRQGTTIEMSLAIRDILKFSSDFKLMERNFSFVTQDGFDIAVGTTALSPKTYGILGKTIAEQFGILTLATGVVVPQENNANNSSDNNSIVPCGLNKEVEVLRTRKNAQTGQNENYYSKEPSPACNVAWGQAPVVKNDLPTLCKKEGEEGYDPNCKENDKFKSIHCKLFNYFKSAEQSSSCPFENNQSGDASDYFKMTLFPITEQCPPLELDFSNAPLFNKLGVVRINKHCEYISKYPEIIQLIRIISMASWFLMALFMVLFS